VEYTFELCPEPDSINREKDLKLWLPVPGEWDSQRAVKIISAQPPPHAEYTDPELGNRMFFWDFGKEPEKPIYSVSLNYRLESFEFRAEIDPDRVGSYDKTSDTFTLYTRSTEHIKIIPEVEALALEAIGDEKNPYLQAKRIFDFVVKKMKYKLLRCDKGAGIDVLLDSATIDEQTGEQYFEGACDQHTEFFVALCRAVGVPARGVTGMPGWGPWIKKEDLKLQSQWHTKLSPDGLAAARIYGPMGGHRWAEFYLPNYGWIPVDATWGKFEWLDNRRVIFTKGTDILIGPNAPKGDGEGYGDQWIPLHNGRIDAFGWGVWNIARVRIGKAKTVHHSDPFPADAFAWYPVVSYKEDDPERSDAFDGRGVLRMIDDVTRGQPDMGGALAQHVGRKPRLRDRQSPYICHMLRQVVGDKRFFDIFETYTNLRVKTGEPVTTQHFQEIAEKIYGESLGWFFTQWLESGELPQLRLENVDLSRKENKWYVEGSLIQTSDQVFQLPVRLLFKTEKEKEFKLIWLDTKEATFEFSFQNKPERITVDPEFDILKMQKMPPILTELWDVYPNLIVVYGTLSEEQANKTAAERFNIEFLGLDDKVVKADIDVNEEDLNTSCLVLFGRPETNLIAQQFKDSFPIEFNGSVFTFQGVNYDQPTQGAAQIVENPIDPKRMIVLYAGLSDKSTQIICDKSEWEKELDDWFLIDLNSSYIVFDGHKKLVSGDWEGFDSNLAWEF
jgi:transglutaminase-like putative cysteine protease